MMPGRVVFLVLLVAADGAAAGDDAMVSSLSARDLVNRQVDVLSDLGAPNLQIYPATTGAAGIEIHSRGSGVDQPGFNVAESPVAIYQDGVYAGRLAGANLDLLDLERVEVLRGPQGVRYGRNTSGGAIRLLSRVPGNEPWLDAAAGLGLFDTMKATVSAGGPVAGDRLAGSIAVLYDKRNTGSLDNPVTGGEPGEYEQKAGRVRAHWSGTGGFDAVLTLSAAELDNDGYNGVPYAPFASAAGAVPLTGFYANLSPSGVNRGETHQYGGNLSLSWRFGAATVKSITGYVGYDDEYRLDTAGGGFGGTAGAPGLVLDSDSSLDQWSEDLQVLGPALGGRLDYLAGLNYLNEDGSQDFTGDQGGPVFAARWANGTDSYAAYADGTYHLTDRLALTAGLRWTRDEKDFADGTASRSDDWDETTVRAGVSFQLDPQRLVYLDYAQGYQAGGYNTLCGGDIDCAGAPFDPETVASVELGYKADVLHGRLSFDADVFYAMYDDFQSVGDADLVVGNVGGVDVHGAEIEVRWAPTDRIGMHAGAGYQEGESGSRDLPGSPRFQGRAGFDYRIPASDLVEFFYGADVLYTGDYYADARNLVRIGNYTRVNGYLGFGSSDRSWQVELAGTNITNQKDNVSGSFVEDLTNVRTPLTPAEYMLTLRVRR